MTNTTKINGYEITTGTVLQNESYNFVGGVLDVDVQVVTPDERIIDGQVFLRPDRYNGSRYGSWDPDASYWASPSLVGLPREVLDAVAVVAGARCDESDLAVKLDPYEWDEHDELEDDDTRTITSTVRFKDSWGSASVRVPVAKISREERDRHHEALRPKALADLQARLAK